MLHVGSHRARSRRKATKTLEGIIAGDLSHVSTSCVCVDLYPSGADGRVVISRLSAACSCCLLLGALHTLSFCSVIFLGPLPFSLVFVPWLHFPSDPYPPSAPAHSRQQPPSVVFLSLQLHTPFPESPSALSSERPSTLLDLFHPDGSLGTSGLQPCISYIQLYISTRPLKPAST